MNQSLPGQFVMPVKDQELQTNQDVLPFLYTDFASHESTREVHSATAIELNDNNVMAFWYGGTREGHEGCQYL